MEDQKENGLVLVARKPCFGLPTACPSCLPVYIYLRFASLSFDMHFDTSNPDSGLFLSPEFYSSLFISGFSSGLDVLEAWMFGSWKESRMMIFWAKLHRRIARIAWFLISTPPHLIVVYWWNIKFEILGCIHMRMQCSTCWLKAWFWALCNYFGRGRSSRCCYHLL